MTEQSLIIRSGFTYIDNRMVSVKFPNPFQTDPLLQYMWNIKSNTALIFSLLGFVSCVWFCSVGFSFLVNSFTQTLHAKQLMPP